MLLPTKHTTIEQSLLGFGCYILRAIGDGITIDELWHCYQNDFATKKYTVKHSFDNLVLTLVFLFSINAIIESDGVIKKCV